MQELVDFQQLLDDNPQLKALKWAYVLTPDQYDGVVDQVMEEVRKIGEYESARIGSAEDAASNTRRSELGYIGPEEGYPLDVEHILMDVIQNHTKTGEDQRPRSYDDTSRFIDLSELSYHLVDKDRSYKKITTYDPVSGKHRDRQITGDKAHRKDAEIASHEKTLQLDNLRRAEQRLAKLVKDHDALKKIGRKNMDDDQKSEYSDLQRQLSGYDKGLRGQLEKAQAALAEVETEKREALGPFKDAIKSIRGQAEAVIEGASFGRKGIQERLRAISAEYGEPVLEKKLTILEVYQDIFKKDWNKFALREVAREEANIIKFIYAIPAEGPIMVEEERFRGGSDSSRAAHSELAQGRNIYAAGEIVFTKEGDKWVLTEVNNGSGHYRPAQDVLNYAKAKIAEELGIDPNDDRIVTRNCIFRGIDVDGLPLEEEAA